jgi:hypothetical protein
MGGDVAWIDVLPSMDKFKQMLEEETATASTAAGKDAGTAFSRAFEAASSTSIAQQQATDLDKAAAQVKKTITTLTQQIAQARAGEREATAKVVLAEQALADARAKYGDESRQVEAAELKLEAARERVTAAATKTTSVEDQLRAAHKEQKTITEQLADATKRLGDTTDQLPTSLSRVKAEAAETGERFDAMRENFDQAEQRTIGFRDGITGVTDSVGGLKMLLSGQGSLGDALFLAGSGFGDLASSGANLVAPMIKNLITRFGALKLTMLGIGGVAAVVGAGLLLMAASSNKFDVDMSHAQEDIERFVRTERLTTTLREMAKGTDEWGASIDRASRSWTGQIANKWSSGNLFDVITGKTGASKDEFRALDEAISQYIDTTGDALGATQTLTALGLTPEQQALAEENGLLPKVAEAKSRLTERTWDQADATKTATDRLKAFKDELRAQADPVFAFAQAQRGVHDAQVAAAEAQKNLTDAIKAHGPNSKEAKAATDELQAANLALGQAQIEAASAATDMANVADETLLPTLEQMKKDGLLSADAFEAMKKKIMEGKAEADRVNGTRVSVELLLKINEQNLRTQVARSLGGLGHAVDIWGGSFAEGGTVPGPIGAPRLIEAHGGELIISNEQQRSPAPLLRPASTAMMQAAPVAMPRELVVIDTDGALVGRMRVEANQVVTDTFGRQAQRRGFGMAT